MSDSNDIEKSASWNSEREFYDLHSSVIFSSTKFYCVTFIGQTDEEFVAHIVQRANIRSGMKILDLGCGSGFLVKRLRDLGCDCLGISTSELCIHQCKMNYPGIPFEVGDMQDFECRGLFRCLALESIGYADRRRVFLNVYRNLLPGGLFYLTDLFKMPQETKKAETNRKSWEYYWKYTAMTVQETINTATECGLHLFGYDRLTEINPQNFRKTLELNIDKYVQPFRGEEFVVPGEMIFVKVK